MKSKDTGALVGCGVYLALLPVMAVFNGYALSMLWQWFVVSTFEARPLGILPAIGVAMVVSYLTKQYDAYKDKDQTALDSVITSVIYGFLNPLFALVFGWILHSFM